MSTHLVEVSSTGVALAKKNRISYQPAEQYTQARQFVTNTSNPQPVFSNMPKVVHAAFPEGVSAQ